MCTVCFWYDHSLVCQGKVGIFRIAHEVKPMAFFHQRTIAKTKPIEPVNIQCLGLYSTRGRCTTQLGLLGFQLHSRFLKDLLRVLLQFKFYSSWHVFEMFDHVLLVFGCFLFLGGTVCERSRRPPGSSVWDASRGDQYCSFCFYSRAHLFLTIFEFYFIIACPDASGPQHPSYHSLP